MRLMVVVIALMLWVAAPTAQTTCNRACLTGFIDTYYKALVVGLKEGMQSPNAMTANDRLVGEFFAVKNGRIQEVHAVLFNLPDSEPTGWPPDYGPGRGGR